MALKSKDIIFICLMILLSLGATIIEFLHKNNWSIPIYYGVFSSYLLIVILLIYRQNQFTLQAILTNQKNDYKQIESLFSLFSLLNIRVPIPDMRDWAVSPDFVKQIINFIYKVKPNIIVELGGGVSTIISAYCLEKIGKGSIFSIDHNSIYANITASNIQQHGLEKYVNVNHAPLEGVDLSHKTFNWYKVDVFSQLKSIDILIIDGPPYVSNSLSRYPALPLLHHLLNDNAIVLIDDGNRDDTNEIVNTWLKEFDDLELLPLNVEKGGFALRKISQTKK